MVPRPPDLNRAQGSSPDIDALIEDAFDYHKWNEAQISQGLEVKRTLIAAVRAIIENVPPCPDRSVALRKLREARMDANSAITHQGKY